MRRELIAFTSTVSIIFACSAAQAQSWGQLKSAACEAEASNKLDDAVSYWKKALEASSPEVPARYVQSLGGLAQCYVRQNKNAEAEELYKKILSMSKEGALTDEQKEALSQYVSFLKKEKRESEAASIESKFALSQAAPQSSERAKVSAGSEDAKKDASAEELKNWQALFVNASKEHSAKNYAQAEKLYQEALTITEKLPAALKPQSETLSRLISLYYAEDKMAQAEPYYVKSMALTRKSSGAESEEYANALRNHGALLRRLNRKNEAMAEEAKADAIMQKIKSASSAGSSTGTSGYGQVNTAGTKGGSIYQRAGAASGIARDRSAGIDEGF